MKKWTITVNTNFLLRDNLHRLVFKLKKDRYFRFLAFNSPVKKSIDRKNMEELKHRIVKDV